MDNIKAEYVIKLVKTVGDVIISTFKGGDGIL